MKIPHAQGVARALRNVRGATKQALKGLNQAAAKRMAKGDYAGAELLVAKGREVQGFLAQSDELLRAWHDAARGGGKGAGGAKGETTPLWGYYQPILRAIVAAGGECTRRDIEAAFEESGDRFLRSGDHHAMAGGRERWKVMIRRARKPLKAEGWVEDNTTPAWRITAAGRKVAERADTGRDE